MHNVTYISDEDRARLVYLNEAIGACETAAEQRKVREEIAEIESRRKPLHECNMLECTELRTFVWKKFERLNNAGKYNIAKQFKQVLMAIELRQRAIHRENILAEQQRLLEKQQKEAEQAKRAKKDKSEKRKGKVSSKSNSSRWTAGIGSLD